MNECVAPLSFDTLVDLWSGSLPAEAAAAAEEHLFGCDACAAASDRLGALVAGLRTALPPVISHAHRDRLVAEGARITVTPVEPGVDAHAVFRSDVDLLIHSLRAPLEHVARLDVEVFDAAGTTLGQHVHVPFDASRGEVLIACQRHYEDRGDPTFRVVAVEGTTRREIGTYRVRHQWR